MQGNNLLMKAKNGDRDALIAWYENFRPLTSRFAYQAGVPIEMITVFHQELIVLLNTNSKTITTENAENRILELAVQLLLKKQFVPDGMQKDATLKFEEDLEVHQAIQKNPLNEKIAVILFYFHAKKTEEIAVILNEPITIIESNLKHTIENIRNELVVEAEGNVYKRLELLAKSYNRIQFPNTEKELDKEIAPMEEPAIKIEKGEKGPVNKKAFAIIAGASLFLSFVIGASFLFNDQPVDNRQTAAEEENPTTISKQMVTNWEAEYEEIRGSAPERLGLSAETFEQLEYVQKADALKERTFSRQNIKQLEDDPKRMQEQVDTLMLSIETPKGMLDSAKDNPLLSSEISKFLLIYTEKTDQLMVIADGLLEQYKEELAIAERDGQLSPDELRHGRKKYPEEIENLTAALSEYTLQYTVHPNEKRFRTMRDNQNFYEIHPFNADMASIQYLDVLWSMPTFDETGMLWPVEYWPQSVFTMATFLSDPLTDPVLKGKVEPQLVHTFFTLLKGDEHNEIFDNNGVVKEQFQKAWESLMQHNSNPVTFMMLPILEEFRESGWKESAHYDQLATSDILYAINLESNGELEEKLPNGEIEIKTASLHLKDYDYSDIQPLYDKFSATHDLNILSGIEPMEIIKLYHYANKIEDSETMWHLTADDVLKPSLEEYMEKWRKRPEISETMRSVEIFEENIHRQGRKLILMAFGTAKERNFNHDQEIVLITERNHIWQMQHPMDEIYTRDNNLEGFDLIVRNHYGQLAESGDLDTIQNASPAEIAGVFLLALEKEDLQMMRLLVNEADGSIDDEEFKMRWVSSGHLPAYSKMGGISFRLDAYLLSIHGAQGHVNIVDDPTVMDDMRHLSMEKVGESWMIGDMFGY